MREIFNHLNKRVTSAALAITLALAGTAVAFTQKPKVDSHNSALNLPVDERPIARDAGLHASFAPVVKKVGPAVVKVFTTTRIHNTAFSSPGNGGGTNMDELFRSIIGDELEQRTPRRNFRLQCQQGVGTGV